MALKTNTRYTNKEKFSETFFGTFLIQHKKASVYPQGVTKASTNVSCDPKSTRTTGPASKENPC